MTLHMLCLGDMLMREHAAWVILSGVQQSVTGGEHVLSLTRLEER